MRCGAWYTPPDRLRAASYFKSTDGHMHQWDFSLKRANLHLIEVIEAVGAADAEGLRRFRADSDGSTDADLANKVLQEDVDTLTGYAHSMPLTQLHRRRLDAARQALS